MKEERTQYYPVKYSIKAVMLVACMLFFFMTSSLHASRDGDPYRYRESGELSAIEEGGHVIIDSKGYGTDPSIFVVNLAGKPITLEGLSVPVSVNFEWSYMPKGPKAMSPVIVYIEETQKQHKNARSAQ